MKESLTALRAGIAERQRRAGASLADAVRLRRLSSDLFVAARLDQTISSLIDRIEDMTQQLLELDARIQACEEMPEAAEIIPVEILS